MTALRLRQRLHRFSVDSHCMVLRHTHTPDTTDSLVASELHNAGAMPQASFCQANAGQTAQQSKTPGMRATPGQHDALDVLQESTMQSLPISDHEENVKVCVVKEPKSIAPIMLV